MGSGGLAASGGWLSAIAWGLAAVVGLGFWVLLARSRLVRGGEMERTERVPQLYGYSVCLIAIVVGLVSLGTIVNKSFTLANPLRSVGGEYGWEGGASLTSFEAYKATYTSRSVFAARPDAEAQREKLLSDPELRTRYEAVRADRIDRTRFDAARDLTGSALLLLVSAGLFASHWRWVKGAEMRAMAARAAVRDLPNT